MEKLSRFLISLFIMILFVGGTLWFIFYVFETIWSLPPTLLSVSKTVFAILPAMLIATMIIGRKKYSRLNAFFYIIASLWVPMFMYIFLVTAMLGIIYAYWGDSISITEIAIGLFSIIAILFVYGISSALYPKIKRYKIHAPALVDKWSNKKIIVFSDSHLGLVRHGNFMQRIADMINKEKPDIVFIAGDLIDGPVFPYDKGLAPLGQIKSTFGTFFSAGNHDEYNIEQEKYYTELQKYVTVLNDRKIILNDTQIIGVMYQEDDRINTKKRLLNTGYDAKLPSIVLLHDPRNARALSDSGVSLSLSGHTHGGQFLPVNLLVWLFYRKLMRGVSYLDKTAQFTSVGAGTAGPLFRLGVKPEVAVLEVN